jgi:hypothetical protein
MGSAGETWITEAEIVDVEEDSGSFSVQTTAGTFDFLRRVGATEKSVIKTGKDAATVAHFQKQIASGHSVHVTLHLDEFGNVIFADGRHRAVAALRSGHERIGVTVVRRRGR